MGDVDAVADGPSANEGVTKAEDASPSINNTESSPLQASRQKPWRNMVAYWLLGLCNNYGYVVMLSAAHDVLSPHNSNSSDSGHSSSSNTTRECNEMSTGTILLADILPSLFVKLIAPFFPFFVHVRVAIVILLSCGGFLLVALTTAPWMTILGVVSTSFASGLGELTILAYSQRFGKHSISMWSSGTGGAGVIGAGSYAGLIALGLTPSSSLLLMLVVPVVMGIAFWLILQHPGGIVHFYDKTEHVEVKQVSVEPSGTNAEQDDQYSTESSVIRSFCRKIRDVPPLFKYMIPLGLVYLFEYFINQGLLELIYYKDMTITHEDQYRYFQLEYQIGVFVSRSSASFFKIRTIWLMAILQFLNVLIFTFEAIYCFIPSFWIVTVLILWEGTLGGAAYVNTYYRIANEIAPNKQKFSLSITTLADAIGIGIAGVLAIPVHNVICALPPAGRFT